MSDRIAGLVAKAQRNLRGARLLASAGLSELAASRAYYAMFYLAQALLINMGLTYSSHAAVGAAFGLQFAKTRLLPPRLHRYLLESFDLRQTSDYGTTTVSSEAAQEVIGWADEFLAAANAYLASTESISQGDDPST
jgi:uncharacterized protein (UPF0332 family)